jgi:hemerythrin
MQPKPDAENIVEWNDAYSVGIKTIDDQHKQLIFLTNELYKGCLGGEDEARRYFDATVRKVVDYAKYHFTSEEKLMARVRYPGLEDHKKEHENFVLRLADDIRNFRDGHKFTPILFVRYLKDWVLSHIAVMDKNYAKYILKLKRDGLLDSVINNTKTKSP